MGEGERNKRGIPEFNFVLWAEQLAVLVMQLFEGLSHSRPRPVGGSRSA